MRTSSRAPREKPVAGFKSHTKAVLERTVWRILALLGTLLVASFVVYGSLYLAPGSALGAITGGRALAPETIAMLENQYGLNESFATGYVQWLAAAVQLDFGRSVVYSVDVWSLLTERLGLTVILLLYSLAITLIVGLTLGVLAGLRGGRVDGVITLATTGALAVPAFVSSVLLVTVFAVGLGAFPTFGAGEAGLDRIWHLTLPAFALALVGTAYVARITRGAVRDELNGAHVQAAVARGLPESLVVRRHVFRNALIPVVTGSALMAAYLIAGTVIVENAFQIDGIGSFLVSSVEAKDFPAVQGATLVLVAAIVLLNTVVDLLYPLLDPRIDGLNRSG